MSTAIRQSTAQTPNFEFCSLLFYLPLFSFHPKRYLVFRWNELFNTKIAFKFISADTFLTWQAVSTSRRDAAGQYLLGPHGRFRSMNREKSQFHAPFPPKLSHLQASNCEVGGGFTGNTELHRKSQCVLRFKNIIIFFDISRHLSLRRRCSSFWKLLPESATYIYWNWNVWRYGCRHSVVPIFFSLNQLFMLRVKWRIP